MDVELFEELGERALDPLIFFKGEFEDFKE